MTSVAAMQRPAVQDDLAAAIRHRAAVYQELCGGLRARNSQSVRSQPVHRLCVGGKAVTQDLTAIAKKHRDI